MRLRIMLLTVVTALSLYAADIEITNGYVRATPPNMPNSAAFMNITNHSNSSLNLSAVTSPVSKVVELHEHVKQGEMMKMQQVPFIRLQSKQTTELKPGGYHVMLIGLNQSLKVGEMISLTLSFSNGETITIQAPVKTIVGSMKMHHQNHHGMQH